jgi:hypothetical protein
VSAAARWLEEIDRRIAGVLESVRSDSTEWPVLNRLVERDQAPHWFELPIWLDDAWKAPAAGRGPSPDLADVLWGQYALFLFIRIQDDLLDRQRTDLDSMFVADRFLVESLESFNRIFILDGRFRKQYHGWLRDTADGIREVGRLESAAGGFTVGHLRLHAKVCAIFKVGSLALCRIHGRERDWPWIEGLLDQLAMFSQIGDDLQDLSEDVRNGRHTWPANVLSGGTPPAEPTAWLFRPERSDVILARLREIAGSAVELVPRNAPASIQALAQGLAGRVDELERGLHEAAVRMVFGEVLDGVRS